MGGSGTRVAMVGVRVRGVLRAHRYGELVGGRLAVGAEECGTQRACQHGEGEGRWLVVEGATPEVVRARAVWWRLHGGGR